MNSKRLRLHDEYLNELFPERGLAEQRRLAALMVAKDLPTCERLLRGESVPRKRLNHRYLDLLQRWNLPLPITTSSIG